MQISYDHYEELLIQRDDRLLTITLNRPDRLNTVNGAMHRELARIFADVAMDDQVDLVVLTGAGDSFSAGGDIAWMNAMLNEPLGMADIAVEGKRIISTLLDLEKPIICRLNGDAIGLGATIALFCDVVIADENAKIADPHVRVGLVAGDGGAVIWPQLIGYARAKEFLMTGNIIVASEAATIGLINRAVPAGELDAEVAKLATKLLRGAQHAIRWTKVSVNVGLKQVASAVFETSLGYEVAASLLPDHREAVTAFVERRAPNFSRKS